MESLVVRSQSRYPRLCSVFYFVHFISSTLVILAISQGVACGDAEVPTCSLLSQICDVFPRPNRSWSRMRKCPSIPDGSRKSFSSIPKNTHHSHACYTPSLVGSFGAFRNVNGQIQGTLKGNGCLDPAQQYCLQCSGKVVSWADGWSYPVLFAASMDVYSLREYVFCLVLNSKGRLFVASE